MKLKLEAKEILTKVVAKISNCGHVYLPKRLIEKKVFVIVPKKGQNGIQNDLICNICQKPYGRRRGEKIVVCKC